MLWWDLDDTLWDMKANSAECLLDLYHGQHLSQWFTSPQEWDEIYHSVNNELWQSYAQGSITRQFLRSERFARPLRIKGVSGELADRLSADWDGLYLRQLGTKSRLLPGATEVLEAFRRAGYTMGIVSNGFKEVQHNKMRSSGIDRYFTHVVLSDEVGVNKPHVNFFRHAEHAAQSENKTNIIVGDNPETDIAGALRAGWKAIWLNNSPDATTFSDTIAHSVQPTRITHLTQLLHLFNLYID